MPSQRPVGSVIIPAWNEGALIVRTLQALYDGIDPREIEVVVACNGCTDDTVTQVVGSALPVTLLDLPAIGKAGAIRAAESVAATLPRLYVDADVRLPGRSAVAVLDALRNNALAARPPITYETAGASWLVRRFYRQRARLPGVRADLCGAGVYGLSAAARRRFEQFPNVIADDLFAARIVDPSEIVIVDCESISVTVPRDARSLIRTLTRVHRGNRELITLMPSAVTSSAMSTVKDMVRSVSEPAHLVDASVYAGVVIIGRLWSLRSSNSWGRDDSSRSTGRER